MKKFLLSVAAALLTALPTFAAKANSTPFSVKQADGTMLTVVLHGDENFHWYSTLDGVVLARQDGSFYVADIKTDGSVVPTKFLAHNSDGRTVAESALAKAQPLANFNSSEAVARRAAMRVQNVSRASSDYLQHTGSPTVLVILAEFQDKKFSMNDPVASFEQYFNGETQKDLGQGQDRNYGSVKKYFTDMSGGKFTPKFKVVGPVTVPENMAYYGANNDARYTQFVTDACLKASMVSSFDDPELDSDNNGTVDLVAIIYAGFGENNGADSNTLWAKTAIRPFGTFNGKSVRTAMMVSELNMSEQYIGGGTYYDVPRINGVGVFCHEMTHGMGFPDLYSTTSPADVQDNQELEYWSLMDGGEYVYNGYMPTAYTAFEREVMGWSESEALSDGQSYTLQPSGPEVAALRYDNPNKPSSRASDYLLFENIQNRGWNGKLPGHGLIAYRVSLKSNYLTMGSPLNNVVGDPGVSIVPADGRLMNVANRESVAHYKKELAGDLFPGTQKVTTLTASQNLPNFPWRVEPKENKMGLYDIAEDTSTGEVSFRFVADTSTPTGISGTPAVSENGMVGSRVFSVDGRCLGTDCSSLPKGIYIIGGKKFVK